MSHSRYVRYASKTRAFYLVVWGLQWQVHECARLEPKSDLDAAMAGTLGRLRDQGWQAEHTADFDFVFIRNGGERRLLSLTTRDPYDLSLQSFDPFRGQPRL